MTGYVDDGKLRARMADVKEAIAIRAGFKHLALTWGVSRPAALMWCRKHLEMHEYDAIREGGYAQRDAAVRGCLRTTDRLELVQMARANRWTMRKLASAMGISGSALSYWLKRNAPFGVEDALEDFSEEYDDPHPAAEAA